MSLCISLQANASNTSFFMSKLNFSLVLLNFVSQQVQVDLSYATSYKKLYQRYKAYG